MSDEDNKYLPCRLCRGPADVCNLKDSVVRCSNGCTGCGWMRSEDWETLMDDPVKSFNSWFSWWWRHHGENMIGRLDTAKAAARAAWEHQAKEESE